MRSSEQKTKIGAWMLIADTLGSTVGARHSTTLDALVYMPFGFSTKAMRVQIMRGFTGQHREADTGYYLLGNGYRVYDPVLMRFYSPDNLSPFAQGGINSYGYCAGDPVNSSDPSGHASGLRASFGIEPQFKLSAIKATDNAPETRQYAGWHLNNEATGWDAKMAIKLPKRLIDAKYYQRELQMSRVGQSNISGWYAKYKLRKTERKINTTHERLQHLKNSLPEQATAISSMIFSMSTRPPTYGRALEDPPAYGVAAPEANNMLRFQKLILTDAPPAYETRRSSV
ncbi:RHS repeat-associated core domain-containing protein [Pseudomonas sp. F16(2018)]|uniref:RHS repeat-associated core domain-containing protein n=1 Tax=Pseudomonas sp. F16(2018) TaxID=2093746 RepID=UPI001119B24B|nr:RHS repeat-associated core domain-containing protein [Pseudomonas sp. F16(2018)]